MLKKYLPLIVLLSIGLFYYWVKTHQRGIVPRKPADIEVNVPALENANKGSEPFNREITRIIYSKHARCRMDCRHIDESEVLEILKEGVINYSRVEETSKGKTYPLEGITHDKQNVRIIFAPHENEMVVVTVIDLDTEWACNCN